jgi:hypothetical protein
VLKGVGKDSRVWVIIDMREEKGNLGTEEVDKKEERKEEKRE